MVKDWYKLLMATLNGKTMMLLLEITDLCVLVPYLFCIDSIAGCTLGSCKSILFRFQSCLEFFSAEMVQYIYSFYMS